MGPPTITSPLHILHLSTPDTPPPTLLKDTPTHQISTPYYTASIPIWHDTLPLPTPTNPSALTAWKAEWSAPEAREVVIAVGAWIISFRKARTKEELDVLHSALSTIRGVIAHHCESTYGVMGEEPLLLAVGMPQTVAPGLEMAGEEWEDLVREAGGWEWIDGGFGEGGGGGEVEDEGTREREGVNEYGEKVGMARLREALEAHEWESRGGDDDEFEGLDDLGLDDDASLGFGEEAMEAQMEIWGMQSSMRGEREEEEEEKGKVEKPHDGEQEGRDEIGDRDVQELEAMMLRMQAVRDLGADMPENERKKFAAKAVREVLKKM